METAHSTLISFFDYNRDHEDGRYLLYYQFPTHYVYLKQEKRWRPRQRGTAVGRVYRCELTQGKRFWLRLLLVIISKPTSFEYLRTY
jgi:ATP-dependent DNA helicase PIF1